MVGGLYTNGLYPDCIYPHGLYPHLAFVPGDFYYQLSVVTADGYEVWSRDGNQVVSNDASSGPSTLPSPIISVDGYEVWSFDNYQIYTNDAILDHGAPGFDYPLSAKIDIKRYQVRFDQ